MNVGSVFFDRNFDFGDGYTGRKLFTVLGTKGGVSIAVKTTTQQRGRGVTYGCQLSDRFPNFFLPFRSCDLDRSSWVCLDAYYELSQRDALVKSFHGIIDHKCDLPRDVARQIQDCALASNDISPEQEDIVRGCLL